MKRAVEILSVGLALALAAGCDTMGSRRSGSTGYQSSKATPPPSVPIAGSRWSTNAVPAAAPVSGSTAVPAADSSWLLKPPGAGPLAEPSKGASLPDAKLPPATAGSAATNTFAGGKRLHLKFDNADSREKFVKCVAQKKDILEEIRVLRRLLSEKDLQMAALRKNLADEFSIRDDRNYQFDAEKKIVFELLPGAEKEKREHLKLTDETVIGRFVELAAARKLATEQVQCVQQWVREKQLQWEQLSKMMADEYSMTRDRDYEYEANTATLYEIIPVPSVERGKSAPETSK